MRKAEAKSYKGLSLPFLKKFFISNCPFKLRPIMNKSLFSNAILFTCTFISIFLRLFLRHWSLLLASFQPPLPVSLFPPPCFHSSLLFSSCHLIAPNSIPHFFKMTLWDCMKFSLCPLFICRLPLKWSLTFCRGPTLFKPLWLDTSDHSASDVIFCLSSPQTVSSFPRNVSIPPSLTWALCNFTQIFPIYSSISMSPTVSLHSTLRCRKPAQIFLSSSTHISKATCSLPLPIQQSLQTQYHHLTIYRVYPFQNYLLVLTSPSLPEMSNYL